MTDDDNDYTAYAQARVVRLRQRAYLLCRDWHLAQDLTQTALTRLYLGWRQARQADNLLAYAQKILLRAYLDHRRRRSTSEAVTGVIHDAGYRHHPDLRLTMLDALAGLSPRDRAIVILRYFEDYSVEQVAEVLDVPVSVVKTQTRRSLAKLREVLAEDQLALFA